MKKSFAELLQQEDAARKKKLAAKLPSWAAVNGLDIPSSLCLEQCSSELTAGYKAGLVGGGRVADITGGLGVDSWAFSKVASRVLHNEADGPLSAAAEINSGRLGLRNIIFSRYRIEPFAERDGHPEWFRAIRNFRPDWIYADPARRDGSGKKVFLPEDCSPDILSLMPALWELADNIMLKLSPMADISLLAKRLGERLTQVHVVSVDGEVRELLCILHKTSRSLSPDVTVAEIDPRKAYSFSYTASESADAVCTYADSVEKGSVLLDPSAALKKAGCAALLSSRFSLGMLAPSTHLYLASGPDSAVPAGMFRRFEILSVLPLSNSGIKSVRAVLQELSSEDDPAAEVSARNVPMTSEQFRSRLGIRPGGRYHVWGCTACGRRVILITI